MTKIVGAARSLTERLWNHDRPVFYHWDVDHVWLPDWVGMESQMFL